MFGEYHAAPVRIITTYCVAVFINCVALHVCSNICYGWHCAFCISYLYSYLVIYSYSYIYKYLKMYGIARLKGKSRETKCSFSDVVGTDGRFS